jgi:hypothetical protein
MQSQAEQESGARAARRALLVLWSASAVGALAVCCMAVVERQRAIVPSASDLLVARTRGCSSSPQQD